MKTTINRANIAYIFQDVNGWYVCPDDSQMLDARGHCYGSKKEAIAAVRQLVKDGQTNYTHYRLNNKEPRKFPR